jgi:cytoskeletal protein CcmA (bactofilin family)
MLRATESLNKEIAMFGFKSSKPQSTIDSLIGVTTVIEGNVSFSGGLRIDGQVRGNVAAAGDPETANSTLVVSESARIQGEIRAAHVVINGVVEGPIHVSGFLELQPKARVSGDVFYKSLEIHLGATIDGKMEHVGPETHRANLKLAANNN